MPTAEHSQVISAPIGVVWEFAKDMSNWAPFLTGYQSHEVRDERASVWTLKGEVGGLSRTVVLDVNVTEWAGPERVTFTFKGLTEQLEGGGSFVAKPSGEAPPPAVSPEAERGPWWRRLRRWLATRALSFVFGKPAGKSATATPSSPAQTHITLALELNAGGAAGPMINMLLGPMLEPVTSQLAQNIAAQVERLHGAKEQA